MKILWIEDQTNNPEEEYFAESIRKDHEICQIQKFDDAFDAISNELIEYDFVVMDLDLRQSDINVSINAKKLMIKYGIEEKEFEKEAGYHLAVELIVNKGFPLKRTVFLTGNTPSEYKKFKNDIDKICFKIIEGEFDDAHRIYKSIELGFKNEQQKDIREYIKKKEWDKLCIYLEDINKNIEIEIKKKFDEDEDEDEDGRDIYPALEKKFNDACIQMPNAIRKDGTEELEKWFNHILKPSDKKGRKYLEYLTLRRGILNMVDILKDEKLCKELHPDGGISKFDKNNFISSIKYFFKEHVLSNVDNDEKRNEEEKQFYLTVCDHLTKIFEFFPQYILYKATNGDYPDWYDIRSSRIPSKFLRNWIAHGLIYGGETTQIGPKDTGFIFMIAVKGIFQLDNKYFEFNSGKDSLEESPVLKDLKLLFGNLEENNEEFREKAFLLHNKKYKLPPNQTDKLRAIEQRGQKEEIVTKSKDYHDALYWKKQDFRYNFYASYLFALAKKTTRSALKDKNEKNKFNVQIDYELKETSLRAIAYKRLNEIENDNNPIFYR